jgi:hypothetical protein
MKTRLFKRLGLTLFIVGLALAAYCPTCEAQGTPFNGFEFALPATIECEQFNRGSMNVAYCASNNVPNTKYRDEGVPIYRCADYDGGSRGYVLKGWSGNWFLYSITNAETASYRIDVRARRVAGLYDGTFLIQIDTNQYTDMTVDRLTSDWQTLTSTINISNGVHILKLEMISGDPANGVGLFDYITIYKDPVSISNPAPQYTTNLLSGTNLADAKANGLLLQSLFDRVPDNGGTVVLPA